MRPVRQTVETDMQSIKDVVIALRQVRLDYGLNRSRLIPATLTAGSDRQLAVYLLNAQTIINLGGVSVLTICNKSDNFCFVATVRSGE